MIRNHRLKKTLVIWAGVLALVFGGQVLAEPPQAVEESTIKTSSAPAVLTEADLQQVKRIVDEAVGERVRPLVRDIARLSQEKEPGFNEIVGGIGYIFGIGGVILYFLSRKDDKGK